MPRPTSENFRRMAFSQQTDEATLVLITIDHGDLPDPVRLSSDTVDTISNGETFLAFQFKVDLPDDPHEGITQGKFMIENIDRGLIEGIRSVTTAPTMQIDIILASDPDVLEASFPGFEMTNVNYNVMTLTANISIESFMTEPWPGDSFLPSKFPAIF